MDGEKKRKISNDKVDMFIIECINKMMSVAGIDLHFDTRTDIIKYAEDNPGWYNNHRISKTGYNEVKEYFINNIKKLGLHFTKKGACNEFSWFWLMYGFIIND